MLFHGQFGVKNESKVPGRIIEGDVVRTKNNRMKEVNGGSFQGRRKGKEKSFCFVVVQFELIFRHSYFYVFCACIEFFGEVGHFTERSGRTHSARSARRHFARTNSAHSACRH